MAGGIPKGRIVEIYGLESSGKTTIASYLAGQVQRQGGVVAYIDAEHALDVQYARTLGLDVSKCIFNQPDYGEQALDIVQSLAESGKVDLIVVDSIAALVPKAELDGEMGDQQMGAQARMLGKFFRKSTGILNKNKCTVIFLNQIRMRIGVMYGNPETTTGGVSVKYYSSIRLEIRRGESIDQGTGDNKLPIGLISKVKNVKNKVGTPFKKGEIKVIFGKGIQVEEEYLTFAVNYNVLERKGAWYYWDGVQIACGMDKTIEYFKQNPKMYEKLKRDTMAVLNPKVNLDGSELEKEEGSESESSFEYSEDNGERDSNSPQKEETSNNKDAVESEKNKKEEESAEKLNQKRRGRKPKSVEIIETDTFAVDGIVPLEDK
jgi:recombination protein RecA